VLFRFVTEYQVWYLVDYRHTQHCT